MKTIYKQTLFLKTKRKNVEKIKTGLNEIPTVLEFKWEFTLYEGSLYRFFLPAILINNIGEMGNYVTRTDNMLLKWGPAKMYF